MFCLFQIVAPLRLEHKRCIVQVVFVLILKAENPPLRRGILPKRTSNFNKLVKSWFAGVILRSGPALKCQSRRGDEFAAQFYCVIKRDVFQEFIGCIYWPEVFAKVLKRSRGIVVHRPNGKFLVVQTLERGKKAADPMLVVMTHDALVAAELRRQ